ncbi:OsmC family protein [Levilactobacillus bambusae]|nr:OsmC family protein [Levilactobacillus bambusae]
MALVEVKAALRPAGDQVQIQAGEHTYLADEPVRKGGTDAGPTPVQYLLSSIGACMSITARYVASLHEDLTLAHFSADVSGRTKGYPDGSSNVIDITITLTADCNWSGDQLHAYYDEVVTKCTVHKTLAPGVPMTLQYTE